MEAVSSSSRKPLIASTVRVPIDSLRSSIDVTLTPFGSPSAGMVEAISPF